MSEEERAIEDSHQKVLKTQITERILETSITTEIRKEMVIISMYIITVLKQQDARTTFTDRTTETIIRTGMKVMTIGTSMMQQTSICHHIEEDLKNMKESHFRRGNICT